MKRKSIILLVLLFIIIAFVFYIRGQYIIKENVNKVMVRYYPGYSTIGVGELMNNDDEYPSTLVEFEITSKKVKTLISHLRKKYFSDSDNAISFTEIMDNYELVINDKYTIRIGEKFGYVLDNEDIMFYVPSRLYKSIKDMVYEYNIKYIYNSILSKNISITYGDKTYNIFDESVIDKINSYQYYVFNNDYLPELDEYDYIINLDNDIKLYLSFNLGCLFSNSEYKRIYIYESDDISLYNYIEQYIQSHNDI